MVRMCKVACLFEDFIDELMHGKFYAVNISDCMRLFAIGLQGCLIIAVLTACALLSAAFTKSEWRPLRSTIVTTTGPDCRPMTVFMS